MVEAWFDSMDDPHALYLSQNFTNKVDPDHYNFIDMTAVGRIRIVSEEGVVVPGWAASIASKRGSENSKTALLLNYALAGTRK